MPVLRGLQIRASTAPECKPIGLATIKLLPSGVKSIEVPLSTFCTLEETRFSGRFQTWTSSSHIEAIMVPSRENAIEWTGWGCLFNLMRCSFSNDAVLHDQTSPDSEPVANVLPSREIAIAVIRPGARNTPTCLPPIL